MPKLLIRQALQRISDVMAVTIIVVTVATGLWIDASFPGLGTAAVSTWVWLLYTGLLFISSARMRVQLVVCLIVATLGELLLSEVLRLYAYPTGTIPLFVPPGHCLLYYAGVRIAPYIDLWVVRSFLILAPAGGIFAIAFGDQLGGIMALGVVLLTQVSRNCRLYAAMAVIAWIMELWGTHLGNWEWAPYAVAEWLHCANPPLGVGIFYCVLDLLVIASTGTVGESIGVTIRTRHESAT